MTLTSQIITDSFRQSNLLPIGIEPTDLQKGEALRYLNRIVKSVFGNEAGEPFTSFPVGSKGYERPSGYPWYDTVPDNDWFIPENTRVLLNLEQPQDLFVYPAPSDGSRFALLDVSKNVSTFPVTLYGNGATIEGQTSLLINTDGYSAEWFFRADKSDWVRYDPLEATGLFPFPEEFDDFFITMLSIRLNPSYGTQLDPQSQMVLTRSRSQLRSRYDQEIQTPSEAALLRMTKPTINQYSTIYQPSAMFNKGWPL